ncbi:MAG: hypothetical protein IT384_10615 [Deltaproteobacteria bacterium]|nr:hypothetical protein [Deltaproteobacteria bacterium]
MNTKKLLLTATLASLTTLAVAPPAWADYYGGPAQPPYVFSVNGPGRGHGALSLGIRGLMAVPEGKADSMAVLPMVGIDYAYGIADPLKLFFNVSTIGVGTLSDVGLELRLLGSNDGNAGLALRAALSPAFFFSVGGGEAAGGAIFAATPGLAFSFGSQRVQLTLGLDAPLYFGALAAIPGATASATGFEPVLRPSVALELPIGRSTNLALSGSLYVPLRAEAKLVIPVVGLGVSF